MAKSNFSKVEKALSEGIIRMTARQLRSQTPSKKMEGIPTAEILSAVLNTIDQDIKRIHKLETGIYKKVGITKQNLKKMIANPALLTLKDWEKIKDAKGRLEKIKKELQSQKPYLLDEDIVEAERKKHINKRFNVREKWLPLK